MESTEGEERRDIETPINNSAALARKYKYYPELTLEIDTRKERIRDLIRSGTLGHFRKPIIIIFYVDDEVGFGLDIGT